MKENNAITSQCSQNGRSMIEMLGVLAIIGVLSVGGIMGYSKAMFRYKINKTIEQISYIVGNVRTTFANQGNYKDVDGNIEIWKKAHIFPDDMWKEGHGDPQHAWEDGINIESTTKNSADTNDNKAFRMTFANLPEEACIELLTHDWNSLGNVVAGIRYGPDYLVMTPANINDAITICEFIIEVEDMLYFYFDVDTSDSLWQSQLEECSPSNGGC